MDLLSEADIVAELRRAWKDSLVDDPVDRHEEGGFVVRKPDGTFGVERWPRGEQSRLTAPPLDAKNCYDGKEVVAAFHTHPNPAVDESGREWDQAPSEADKRWHARRKLQGFVISRGLIYGIDATGTVQVIGTHEEVLLR